MPEVVITGFDAIDVRFPTSLRLDGSDAMNPAPDYSAAYLILRTSDTDLEGHGFCFTIGRGTEICVQAIRALAPVVVGQKAEDLFADMGGLWRRLVGDSQLRWLGPEKGVIHMATAAVVNAVWDLYAKTRGKPLWKLLADLDPEEIVALVDFRYLTDALTPDDALELLRARTEGRAEREADLAAVGYPAYDTSPGWLGYDDDKLRRRCREAVAAGFTHVKVKVGANLEDDLRRLRIAREVLGPYRGLMLDANQVWSVPEAIAWVRELAPFEPWWIEEPTSPDDILGHAAIARSVAPIRVVTGEHTHNRVMFKQLLQAGAVAVCQVDACRLAGVNEVVAVLLLAAKFGVPVCPHAGGVGLCELVVHLSAFDYVAVSGSLDGRMIEYVDHLHEHFVEPVRVVGGRYLLPRSPGYAAMTRRALDEHRYPDGSVWSARCPTGALSASPVTAAERRDRRVDQREYRAGPDLPKACPCLHGGGGVTGRAARATRSLAVPHATSPFLRVDPNEGARDGYPRPTLRRAHHRGGAAPGRLADPGRCAESPDGHAAAARAPVHLRWRLELVRRPARRLLRRQIPPHLHRLGRSGWQHPSGQLRPRFRPPGDRHPQGAAAGRRP